jgi:hypothetical protein
LISITSRPGIPIAQVGSKYPGLPVKGQLPWPSQYQKKSRISRRRYCYSVAAVFRAECHCDSVFNYILVQYMLLRPGLSGIIHIVMVLAFLICLHVRVNDLERYSVKSYFSSSKYSATSAYVNIFFVVVAFTGRTRHSLIITLIIRAATYHIKSLGCGKVRELLR